MSAAINRRGACPALAAPMQTGDGLLVRLNPVSQGITPSQLIGLCESARRHGNGVVEITSRGSFQIRGLTTESAALLAVEVDELAVVVRTGVPVETGAVAGLDPNEIADPRPVAQAIRDGIARQGMATRLAPKVSVVVDGGGASGLRDVAADVRLEAVGTAWRVSVGGTAETARHVVTTDPDSATARALSILAEIAALGREARGRDLEIFRLVDAFRPPDVDSSTEVSARWLLTLTDDRVALVVALPFGSSSAEDLADFAKTASDSGCRELRFAPERKLMALLPDADEAARLRSHAESLGFIVDPHDPRRAIVVCPGSPACASSHFDTREAAREIIALAPDLLGRRPHISGCSKGCAHPGKAALTLVGGENGVGLVVNGTARDKPRAYVDSNDIAGSVARLARQFDRKNA